MFKMPSLPVLALMAAVALLGGASTACGADAPESASEDAITSPTRPSRGGLPEGVPTGEEASPVRPPVGSPLPVTPTDRWTWLGPEHFGDQAKCMDGSTTGLAINPHPGATKVLLYMQGGAACFDGQTCAIAEGVLGADHANEKDFATWTQRQGDANVFNRGRADNPFRDYTFVMLPYCSGDVFAGDNSAGYEGRPQHGYRNVSAYLTRLAPTLRDMKAVVLSGMSAGGYGAVYNFVQVQNAFPRVDVTLINDSGPIFATKYTTPCLQQKFKTTWGLERTLPLTGPFVIGYDKSGVAGNGLVELFQAFLDRYPKSKFAFLSSEADLAMRYFHGIGHTRDCALPGLLSASFFAEALRDARTVKNRNFSTFYGPGAGHPYLASDAPMYDTRVDGISIAEWLGKIVTTGDEPRRVPATF